MDTQKLWQMYINLPEVKQTEEMYRLTGLYEISVDEGDEVFSAKVERAFLALVEVELSLD